MNEFLELTKSQLDLTRQVIAKSSYFLWIIYHIMKEICLTVVTYYLHVFKCYLLFF